MAMNPAGHPAEAVPLQGRYDGLPGQPGAATVVQYTTVNINSEPPKDHIIWSLCCFAYSNPCCLGLAALIFSIKARDRKVVGDLEGARHYASTARCLNIVSTVLAPIIFIISLIVIISMIAEIQNMIRSHTTFRHNSEWPFN
ncbi:interferon-induced transmembrane protein 1-like [Chaetodon trifascialis]|uniref:interferon-induced transmembrane protein 1-like n=1 Tax=Chaetodon trifascialis TaxID=109706 RepID=UPI0039936088